MKKLFTLLLMAVLSVTAYAQEERKHMEFMGIEINGQLDKFVDKLIEKGFTIEQKTKNAVMLSGEFASEADCKILVSSTDTTVYRVSVFFPTRTTWSSLSSDYYKYKEAITKKYFFKPIKSQETFLPPYYEGDGYEMTAVKTDQCVYASQFKIITGDIFIAIMAPGHLVLSYEDYANGKINDANEEKKVSDDL